jgi:nitroimidazol reductase NimA-like FMN-containing flavoprotein (pyridoxamine 5'-phosphate oxidase superfamily)
VRRADQEIATLEEIEEVIRQATVCHLAMCKGLQPYVVPLCFGYERGALYVHSASQGTKLDWIHSNPHVCFQFEVDVQVLPAADPCGWSVRYRSVIGRGRAVYIGDPNAKYRALEIIMRQYTSQPVSFSTASVGRTTVFRIEIDQLTGKQSRHDSSG